MLTKVFFQINPSFEYTNIHYTKNHSLFFIVQSKIRNVLLHIVNEHIQKDDNHRV